MSKKFEMIKPFEFILRVNDNIICQRYFTVNNYNVDSRESLEIKEMMDDIVGVNQKVKLGLIPELLKYQCIDNTYKVGYYNNSYVDSKGQMIIFEIRKNNINSIKNANGTYDSDDLEVETIASAGFDGSIFHSSVRSGIDIRSIIPDIINTINYYLGLKEYTKVYGDVTLNRLNDISKYDIKHND